LQSLAIVGSLLLLTSLAFVAVKRSGRGGSPVAWFSAHILASTLGAVLVFVHASGKFGGPPALLLLALIGLVILGVWARVGLARRMANTFGTKRRGFEATTPETRSQLEAVLKEKRELLQRLDPAANEATFSVTLAHLLRAPTRALAYQRLTATEGRLIGKRASVGRTQAYWRVVHQLLAWGFVVGLAIHVVTVTFFAGYVAEGREIYWWHVAAW